MGAIATPPAAKPRPPHDEWVVLIYNGDLLTGVFGPFKTQDDAADTGRELTPQSEQHAVTYPLNLRIGSREIGFPAPHPAPYYGDERAED